MKEELSVKDEQLNKKINDALMKERKHINVRQKIEIENIRKQHKKEIDVNIILCRDFLLKLCFCR
jgi:hypothetical protein